MAEKLPRSHQGTSYRSSRGNIIILAPCIRKLYKTWGDWSEQETKAIRGETGDEGFSKIEAACFGAGRETS